MSSRIEDRVTRRVEAERTRLATIYRQRDSKITGERYAPWLPGEMLICSERKRLAAAMLRRQDVFPTPTSECLEVGYGHLGWLADLVGWGVREAYLHGIELDAQRAQTAQAALPVADLRTGDATRLPWRDDTFSLVIVSTVFSSVLDPQVRWLLAEEIKRVTAPGGACLCYDLAVNNPRNPSVKKFTRDEMQRLFRGFEVRARSLTLAPPLARYVADWSWPLATLMSNIPYLRTHRLAVMTKRYVGHHRPIPWVRRPT